MQFDNFAHFSQQLEGQTGEFKEAVRKFEEAGRNLKKDSLRNKVGKIQLKKESETHLKPVHNPVGALWDAIFQPEVNIDVLLPFSAMFRFSLVLDKPYLSRDENLFYIIDNPVRREKVFNMPYVAASSWKGSLRSALRSFDSEKYSDDKEIIRRLFGNERGTEEQAHLRAGCLCFYHTYFNRVGMEVINPHDRETRAGRKPIYLECVPAGTKGVFTLLYLPIDLKDPRKEGKERKIVEQVGEDLQTVAMGLKEMLTVSGFGAKTSSGYGLARDCDLEGDITVKYFATVIDESTAQLPEQQTLPRYLEAPDRLIANFRSEDGSLREFSPDEISRLNKAERQLYEKAKKWSKRGGKALSEVTADGENNHEHSTNAAKSEKSFFSRPFATFTELEQCVKDFAEMLKTGGQCNDRES